MAVTIEARLLSGSSPQRVQVTVAGLVSGDVYEVLCTWDGGSYQVAGGEGISDGDQVVLVDPWAPLNLPVVYTVSVAGQVVSSSDPLTVVSTVEAVLTSLDGRVTVPITVWRANGVPRTRVRRSVAYDVPGRPRPPGRFVSGGVGGGDLVWRIAAGDVPAMESMLDTGEPLVVRSGGVRGFPASELVQITGESSELFEAAEGSRLSESRVWSVSYLLVDNPDPSVVLIAFTWTQFDEVYAGSTWDDFDAEWSGRTWDDLDREDWGSRL